MIPLYLDVMFFHLFGPSDLIFWSKTHFSMNSKPCKHNFHAWTQLFIWLLAVIRLCSPPSSLIRLDVLYPLDHAVNDKSHDCSSEADRNYCCGTPSRCHIHNTRNEWNPVCNGGENNPDPQKLHFFLKFVKVSQIIAAALQEPNSSKKLRNPHPAISNYQQNPQYHINHVNDEDDPSECVGQFPVVLVNAAIMFGSVAVQCGQNYGGADHKQDWNYNLNPAKYCGPGGCSAAANLCVSGWQFCFEIHWKFGQNNDENLLAGFY